MSPRPQLQLSQGWDILLPLIEMEKPNLVFGVERAEESAAFGYVGGSETLWHVTIEHVSALLIDVRSS